MAAAFQWNPNDKDSSVTLSGANLIASQTTGGVDGGVRSNMSIPAGTKVYSEVTFAASGTLDAFIGLAQNADSLTSPAPVGGDIATTGVVRFIASVASNGLDVTIWAALGAGGWLPSGDPGTGSGGLTYSFATADQIYLQVNQFESGNSATLNTGDTAFSYSVPSGCIEPRALPTVFHPHDKPAAVTISGGNLVATFTASAQIARLNRALIPGEKRYAEINVSGASFPGFYFVADTRSASLTTAPPSGRWLNMPATGNPSRIRVAYSVASDSSSVKVWLADDAGSWSPTGDPAAGTGGTTTTLTAGTPYNPSIYNDATSEVMTLNAGLSAFTYSIPSGFDALDIPAVPWSTLVSLTSSGTATVPDNAGVGLLLGSFGGKTPGSTLTLQSDTSGQFAIEGGDLTTVTTLTPGTYSITVRESLATATNTPLDTTLSVVVTAAGPALTWLKAKRTNRVDRLALRKWAPSGVTQDVARAAIFGATAGGSPYTLTAATASYSLTGTAVSLYEAKRMPANTASYALAGTAAITARGKAMPAATAAYALTGTAASVLEAKRLVGATASYALTGTAATLTYTPVGSYSLTAATASYSLTGSAVAFQRTRIMSAATASYALTGTAATLTKTTVGAFTLTATTAGYSLSGTAVALKDNRRLVAATASYALSGAPAGILRARVMAGATAAYSLTGTAAITKRGRSMAGASGSYALTGTADALKVGRRLVATTAGYSLAGAANSMSRGRTLVGATRSYALTGTSVAFKRTYKLGAESGAYVYSGSGVVLINSADSLIAYPIYGRTLSAAAITQGGPLIASPLAASTLTANPL